VTLVTPENIGRSVDPGGSMLPVHNLPGELSSFIGRAADVERLSGILARDRLVTVTGAGGAGKTRLARRVAEAQVEQFADGVWWVELAAITDGATLVDAVARAVGLAGEPGDAAADVLAERMRSRRLLLVMDNCEHLLEPVVALVERILRAAPEVRVLATSREALTIDGEVAWRIDPMAASDAVRLFVDRAARARSSFAPSADETVTVAAICAQLDGMPLAIELAAARCRSLPPAEILRGLQDVFGLLRAQRRGVVARQHTLEASIEWSHALLHADEQVLLRRLSVFAGGFTAADAAGIVTGDALTEEGLLDALDRLVAQSMVVLDDAGRHTRYRLLETVRQYAARRLLEANEASEIRVRHAQWFLDLARAVGPGLEGPGDLAALERSAPEVDNFRRAGETLDDAGRWAEHAEMITATTRLWELVAPTEAVRDLAAVIGGLGPTPSLARARALLARSRMYGALAGFAPAISDAQDALTMTDDLAVRGRARFALALVISFLDVEMADALFVEARADSRAAGDDHAEVEILVASAIAWLGFRGDMPRGWAIAEEATPRVEALGDRILIATHEAQLAIADALQGRYDRALHRVELAERVLAEIAGAAGSSAERVARSLNVGSPIEFARTLAQLATLGADAPLERLPGLVSRAEADGMPGLAVFVGPLLGVWERVTGDIAGAGARFDHARQLAQSLGAATWTGVCAAFAAECARQVGDTAGAGKRLDEIEAIGQDQVGIFVRVRALTTRAAMALAAGELGEAERLTHDAVTLAEPHRYLWELVVAVELLARVAAANESWVEAARLGGAAARLRGEHGFLLDFEDGRGALADALALSSERAGPEAFDAAFEEARALDLEAAVAFARRARGTRGRPRFGWDSLTPTERSVVEQVEAGLGNAEIARTLLMSVATVKTHLNHVFTKLGVTTRTELAAMAVRRRAGID
jgi:predicted ATPase/DNA-binding CsgD family transcriptional regulator